MSKVNSIAVNTSPGAYYISSGVSESAVEIQETTMNLKFDVRTRPGVFLLGNLKHKTYFGSNSWLLE